MFRPLILASLLLVPAAAQAVTVYTTEATTAHAGPSRHSAEVTRLAACTAVESTGMVRGWLAVETDHGPAFVRAIRTASHAGACFGGPAGGEGWSGGNAPDGGDSGGNEPA